MMRATSLKEWVPDTSGSRWNHVTAAHLLRRTGFAPSLSELYTAISEGLNSTVDRLIETATDTQRHDELEEIGPGIAARGNINELRGWWLLRMQHTRRPLHARLAVMWHNHFATSNSKVASPTSMLRQLKLIETHATGSFHDLLMAIAKDPAMIVWLDSPENVKGRPNENFARELFELFTLGVGNYTEKDIQEAARAFTGWNQKNGVFRFRAREHDNGEKTVLGVHGNFIGEDICNIATSQPACATFIATRLLREFVSPEPEDELVRNMADELASHKMDIGESLRTLFKSEAFFHPSRYRSRIKSPVEFAIGMVRSLHLHVSAQRLSSVTVHMGQSLFEPPSVKGWDGHKTWINSTTMLVRLNTAQFAASAVSDPTSFFVGNHTEEIFSNTEDSQHHLAALFGDLLLDGRVPPPLWRRIQAMRGEAEEQASNAINLLLTSPEYQLA